jgi:hypothetical protein
LAREEKNQSFCQAIEGSGVPELESDGSQFDSLPIGKVRDCERCHRPPCQLRFCSRIFILLISSLSNLESRLFICFELRSSGGIRPVRLPRLNGERHLEFIIQIGICLAACGDIFRFLSLPETKRTMLLMKLKF